MLEAVAVAGKVLMNLNARTGAIGLVDQGLRVLGQD